MKKMNFISKTLLTVSIIAGAATVINAQDKKPDLRSPDGHIEVSINITDKIYYSVSANHEPLLVKNFLQMGLKGETLGKNPELTDIKRGSADEIIKPYISLKFSVVRNHYNSFCSILKGDMQ